MKLVSFTVASDASPRVGVLVSEDREVLDLFSDHAALPRPGDLLGCFDLDGAFLSEARGLHGRIAGDEAALGAAREAGAVHAKASVSLLAPIPRPGKIICIGLNYKDHAAESKLDPPERPLAFSKFSNCVAAPGQDVIIPPGCENLDYEAELGVVIGRRATRVSGADAEAAVLGYVCFNDVSARDFQFADGQWQRGKSADTFAPFGEYVATTDEIADPHALRIQFRLNGETLQDSNTDQLIHRIPAIVEALSAFITLEPGDVIATGTPPGVGFARKPPVWLKPGDRMEVEIEGLGVLANPVVAP